MTIPNSPDPGEPECLTCKAARHPWRIVRSIQRDVPEGWYCADCGTYDAGGA